jgi:HAE1 family hydrophobic/amphiphilic exporter-1
MNFSAPFIERPVMTTLLMVAIFCVGLVCYFKLPISNMPNVSYPVISVTVSFPGTTPETMAQAVALPLEKQFMAIPGVKLVTSTNTLGNSTIVLQFDIDKDMNTAAQDVQSAIITATPQLPPTLPFAPVYRKVNPAELPIVYISLTSPTEPLNDLFTYANTVIGQRISMLKGVSQVTTFGSPLAVRVQIDPSKLASVNVTLAEVSSVVALGNPILSTGQLNGKIEAPNIVVDGQLTKGAAYDRLILAYRNGAPVRIEDVGRAIDDFQNQQIQTQYANIDGVQPSLLLAIQKEPSGNAVQVSDAIHDLLEELKVELPPTVDLSIFFDRSISIRESVTEVNYTLLIALVLVIAVIFLYLGSLSDTIIPAIVLPLSVIGTFIVMSILNYTLDTLSLLALTLAIGFIVDDVIVVIENIVRYVEHGLSPREAAFEGSKQIGFTIVSMTLSLVAVFIPMLFMGGLMGKIFKEFAVTLTTVTLISGVLSLTLTPMLCSRLIPARDSDRRKSKMAEWSAHFNEYLSGKYRRLLTTVIGHKIFAILIFFFCLAATIFLFFKLPIDFLPEEDVGFFIAYAQGAQAGASEKALKQENQILEVLRTNPSIESVVGISSYSEYRNIQNLIRLKPSGQRPPVQQVIQEIKLALADIPGIQVFIKNVPIIDLSIGVESRGNYQFALHGIHSEKTYPSAKKLIAAMEKDPLFVDVNTDLEIDAPQVNMTIMRDKASTFGITATDIENAFLFGYSNNRVSRINTTVDQYDVIVEIYPQLQREAIVFNQLWLRSGISSQQLVPLSAIATWEEVLGATNISHINQFPSATIDFNLAENVPLETALEKIQQYISEFVDPTVVAIPIGAAETFRESTKNATILLVVAIFSIYIILGMLYESFFHPITVLTTLPPATLGGLLTLWIFDMPLSMYSYLGIILLIGIVKKNGIMMVDFAIENIRQKGMTPTEAIIDACLVRFRPIMMTTMAAIAGAIPIAVGFSAGALSRRPLGLVIIGGLVISQLITLFITPILYLAIERFNSRWSKPLVHEET